jgi:hypothetical protein
VCGCWLGRQREGGGGGSVWLSVGCGGVGEGKVQARGGVVWGLVGMGEGGSRLRGCGLVMSGE